MMKRSLRKRFNQQKPKNVLIAYEPNWIDRYVEISMHLCFGDFDRSWFEDIHLDILRDLCNENLPPDYVLHLLSLLEMFVPLLDSEDKIEQTIGSLLNILNNPQSSKRPLLILSKFTYCATSLMLFTHEWRHKSESIEQLYTNFIKFLLEKSHRNKSPLQMTCLNCLTEISNLYPDLIESTNAQLTSAKNLSESLYMMSINHWQQNSVGLRDMAQSIQFVPDLKFYHASVMIFGLIDSGQYNDSLSPMILKTFLQRFISSNALHDIHFALKLLIRFGFEIFSSTEEEVFLKQLVILSTLPSLPIGYRLLCLSFIKIAFISIYKPPLNSPPIGLIDSLCPYLFDGPDTQEKKMAILNEFSFAISDKEYYNLLSRMHKLSSAQCSNYRRATSSLFRVLNFSLKKRAQLMDRILDFLQGSIFSLSYIHFMENLFAFLSQHWDFAQQFVDKFIAKLMILKKDQDCNESAVVSSANLQLVPSYSQYFAYLRLINWFLSIAHHHIVLTEFQVEFLVNFIRINCIQWPQSSTLALTCCTSILYYQRVTPKVKEAMLIMLEWLKNERKMDIETSSLAQIYLLALRTLKEEYIKQVFTSDEEEFHIQKIPQSLDGYLGSIVRNERSQCPLVIRRVNSESINQQMSDKPKYGSPLGLAILFDISISSESSIDRFFCVETVFTSQQIENFKQIFQHPFLERKKAAESVRVSLNLDFKLDSPFWLNIAVKFVDYQGTIYNYAQAESAYVPLEDLFIVVDINPEVTNKPLEEICQTLLQQPDALQTVICLRAHADFETFFQKYSWMKRFIVEQHDDHSKFAIGLSPDRLIIGSIRIVNNFINLFLNTNNYEIIPSLLLHTFSE